MDGYADFYAFYNRVLRPEVARVESLRQQTVTQAWALAGATALGTVFWAMLVSRLLGWSGVFVIYACVIPPCIGFAIWTPIWRRYRDSYQLNLIAALVRLYNGSFEYDRDDMVGEVAFVDCGLFPRYPGSDARHYRGTDCVSGKLGVTPFEFSDLDVSVSRGKSREQIFKGVFFVADFNKNFSGETYVTSRHSFLAVGPQTPPGEVVTLEDPEFERMFATHSTSQVEARYILSPALMRRILHFAEQNRKPIGIAFCGKNMYIAMYNASTRMEPVLWQTLQNSSLFFGIWANLEFLCGIVNEMDLNTRIWTKDAPAVAEPATAPGIA